MGWVISWFVVPVAVLGVQVTTCTQGSEESWRASLFVYSPLAFGLLAAIWLTARHHTRSIILAAPLVIIVPHCMLFSLEFLLGNSINGINLCAVLSGYSEFADYPADGLLRVWAPVQITILGLYAYVAVVLWRKRCVT